MKIMRVNDAIGGGVAGLVAVPEAAAYAVVMFSPLALHRPEVLPVGIVSCILAIVLANAIPCIMGGPRILISAPFSLTAVMIGALAAQVVVAVTPAGGGAPDIDLALVLIFAVISISGLIQILLGLFRLGDLAKYMPMPVIAGLRNGAAIAIVVAQAHPLLGLAQTEAITFDSVLWPTLIIGLFCVLVIAFSARLTTRLPGALLAIIAGTVVYYITANLNGPEGLTEVIGDIPTTLPTPHLLDDFYHILTSAETLDLLIPLLPTAVGIAVLNTLQTLVAIVTADSLMETRSRSNQELVGLGLGNLVAGMFGAVPASGSVSSTLLNHNSGGQDIGSRLSAAIVALSMMLLFGSLIGYLPKIVLAGSLVGLAIFMFDRPSLKLLADTIRGRVSRTQAAKDLSVIFTVMVILLAFGPLVAVGAGILVALGQFLLSMTSDNVRRESSGAVIRSFIHRNDVEYAALDELGKQVHIMELEGPLFFGTSDRLASIIEARATSDLKYILLDFTRVSEIDTTAVSLICQARSSCLKKGVTLVLCSLESKRAVARFIRSSQIFEIFGTDCVYDTADDGLAYIEDQLLDGHSGIGRYENELASDDAGVLKAIGAAHLKILAPALTRQTFRDQETVFGQGSAADAIYFILKGQVTIEVRFGDGNRRKFGVLCPGAVFGEMAVLDRLPRSAGIIAAGDLVCLKLTLRDLDNLVRTEPATSHALMAAIGLELSKRIRVSNKVLTELKSSR
ncbi:MAG: SulP family inorganic anion transporter [Rhodospirillales bacterium]